jgi:hypothetical protein
MISQSPFQTKLHLRGGYDSDSEPEEEEDDLSNLNVTDSGFEDWRVESWIEGESEDGVDERDDGEEADWYEDDERDYSL